VICNYDELAINSKTNRVLPHANIIP